MKYFLKPNVVIEPLFDNWYAWSHLISPATAGLNIVKRHLRIMDSYILNPKVHAAAVSNAKMKGGPFIDYKYERVEEVKALKANTLSERKQLIRLAEALETLNELLKGSSGYSLQPLYENVPEILKGYVELVYDLNNQPSYRLFESLLYQSEFYDTAAQRVSMWLTNNDERPFVLSTPRLEDEFTINVPCAFSSEIIDELSCRKRTAGDIDVLIDAFKVPAPKKELFRSFFTEEPPVKYERYAGDKVRMRYFGHACVLLETAHASILVDPVISYYGYQYEVDRFSDIDLPDHIDYVMITHNHQDHILLETLLPLRHRIGNLIVPRTTSGSLQDPNLKYMFENLGFKNVKEIGEFEAIQFQDATITGIPFIGEHCDLNIQSKTSYYIQIERFSLLFMADSCNVAPALYKHVKKQLGHIDVLFLGMECHGAPLSWLYGPLLPDKLDRMHDESRRLAGSDFEQGRELIEALSPAEVYVYAMGQEPWLEFISSIKYTPESHPIVQSDMLIKYCHERNIVAERLFGEKEILYTK